MTPERWAEVNDVLQRAMQLAPADRPAYLDHACASDEELRREVESLLSANEQAGSSFLRDPQTVGLTKGTRLGYYEVQSLLGSGGMGEVYRARDLRLRRDVAIKVLPAFVSTNPERLRRFEQEALATAALNHPNILAVYQMATHEGASYMVTELLEGETLREGLRRGPILLRKAIDYGVQIANGLAAAHEKGIVHRDLKPENLFVTKDGRVKILDFGLVKLSQPKDATGQAPTRTLGTEPGVVMGTVGYMSPEQVRGQPADARSDIFALGVILYEMLTGQRAFRKETSAETMAAILNEDPPPVSQTSSTMPPGLQRIISRCLMKNPEQRFHSAHDLAFALEALTDSAISSPSSGPQESKKPNRLRIAITATAVVIVLALIAVGAYVFAGRKKTLVPFQTMTIERLTTSGTARRVAISPDGKYAAYVTGEAGKQSLRVRQTATRSDIEIIPPAEEHFYGGLTFSPDGNYVLYVQSATVYGSGTLYQIPTLGGTPRKVAERLDSPVAFSPEGKRLAFVRDNPGSETALVVMEADGTGERQLVSRKIPDPFAESGMSWSPDGKNIAIGAYSGGTCYVMTVQVADGSVKRVGSKGWHHILRVAWLANSSGFVLGAQGSANGPFQLWELSYPDGQARRITNDLSDYVDLDMTADSGALVTVLREVRSNLWVGSRGAPSQARQIGFGVATQEGVFGLVWTPEGGIAYGSLASGRRELWVMSVDGSHPRQLTSGADLQFFSSPSSCPDGSILFASGVYGGANIWRIDPDGGNQRQLTREGTNGAPSCSPDGKWAIFNASRGGDYKLWRVPLQGGTPEQLTDYASSFPSISPNGKWIAFDDYAHPQANKIGVISFAGSQPLRTFDYSASSSAGYPLIRWTQDGRELTYIVDKQGVSNIWAQPFDGGPPKQLTDFTAGQIFNFAWSPDGRQIVLARGSHSNALC